jgi:serine phosphatase RsbU (regulator of sigma subunit)
LIIGVGVGVGVPLFTTLLVSHSITRVLIPAEIMLVGAVTAGMIGNLWIGLMSTAFASVSLWYWFVPPHEMWSGKGADEVSGVVLFVGSAVGLCLLVASLRSRVAREAQRRVRESRERSTLLASAAANRAAVESLQRALLPTRLPLVNGIEISARYLATSGIAMGGDWYAVIPLGDDRVGLACGDVAGHGIEATASMAEIRFALRALAADGSPPNNVLRRVNELVHQFDPDTLVTAVYGILDSGLRTWTFAAAGHLPGIIRGRGGDVEFMPRASGPPLGVVPHARYEEGKQLLPEGSTVVLYTDGLIERRGESIETGLARLASVLRRCDGEPGALSDRLIAKLLDGLPEDDVAILAARVA